MDPKHSGQYQIASHWQQSLAKPPLLKSRLIPAVSESQPSRFIASSRGVQPACKYATSESHTLLRSHHIASCRSTSHRIMSHHITSHHIISHRVMLQCQDPIKSNPIWSDACSSRHTHESISRCQITMQHSPAQYSPVSRSTYVVHCIDVRTLVQEHVNDRYFALMRSVMQRCTATLSSSSRHHWVGVEVKGRTQWCSID